MSTEPAVSSIKPADYITMLAVTVTAGSIFLPWFHVEVTTTFEGFVHHTPYGSFRGTFVEGGWLGLSFSLLSIVLLFLQIRWGVLGALCNALVGLGYLTGQIDLSKKFIAANAGSALMQVEPQSGLYLFVFSSLLSVVLILRTHYASRVF